MDDTKIQLQKIKKINILHSDQILCPTNIKKIDVRTKLRKKPLKILVNGGRVAMSLRILQQGLE